MPPFHYKAIDAQGQTVSGSIEAHSRKDALTRLQAQRYQPLSIRAGGSDTPKSKPFVSEEAPSPTVTSNRSGASLFKRKRSRDALALAFLRQVHQLHRSGMPIGDAIKSLNQRLHDPELKGVAQSLWRELSEGHSFAATVRKQGGIFDASAAYLIEAGEATGNLVPVLENIIANLENRIALRKRVIAGLAYPALICVLAMAVTMLVLFFLLPRMLDMMDSMNGELSIWARLLIGLSEGALLYGPPMLLAGIIGVVTLSRWRLTERGRATTDGWLLRLPVIGGIVLKIDLCRITNLMATLLSSGVNTTEALKLTERTVANVHLQARFRLARGLINDGASFSSAFRRHGLMNDNDLDILSVGENVGTPARSFQDIYEHHNDTLASDFNIVTTVILSGAFALAFSLVALIIVSVITMVFDMSKAITPT